MQELVDKVQDLFKKRAFKYAITGFIAGIAAVKLFQYAKLVNT